MPPQLKSPIMKPTTRSDLKASRPISPAKTADPKNKRENQREPEIVLDSQNLVNSLSPYLRNLHDPTLVPFYPAVIDEFFTSEPVDSALDFDSDESIDIMNLMYK